VEKTLIVSPYEGIVPYTGFYFPKLRFPPAKTTTKEKYLFPNTPNKEKGIYHTGVV
jgi:hypothetical protein